MMKAQGDIKLKSILVIMTMTMIAINKGVNKNEQTEDSEKVEHFPPQLAHHGTC